jgi:hypothetical protein
VAVTLSTEDWRNVPAAPALYGLTFVFENGRDSEDVTFLVARPVSTGTQPVLQLVTSADGNFGTFAWNSRLQFSVTVTLSGTASLHGWYAFIGIRDIIDVGD